MSEVARKLDFNKRTNVSMSKDTKAYLEDLLTELTQAYQPLVMAFDKFEKNRKQELKNRRGMIFKKTSLESQISLIENRLKRANA